MLLSLLLIFLPQNEPDTINWKRIRVHEYLELELPDKLELTDTLGQTIYSGKSDYAIVLLSIVPEQANPKNVNYRFDGVLELIEFYDGTEKGSVNSAGGEISSSQDLRIDDLDSRDYTIKFPNNELKRFVWTIVKDQAFMLFFWYHEDFEEEVNLEVQRTKSMNFTVEPSEQLNPKRTEDSQAYKIGELFGRIIGFLLIAGIIFLIYYLTKRKKKRVSNKH